MMNDSSWMNSWKNQFLNKSVDEWFSDSHLLPFHHLMRKNPSQRKKPFYKVTVPVFVLRLQEVTSFLMMGKNIACVPTALTWVLTERFLLCLDVCTIPQGKICDTAREERRKKPSSAFSLISNLILAAKYSGTHRGEDDLLCWHINWLLLSMISRAGLLPFFASREVDGSLREVHLTAASAFLLWEVTPVSWGKLSYYCIHQLWTPGLPSFSKSFVLWSVFVCVCSATQGLSHLLG